MQTEMSMVSQVPWYLHEMYGWQFGMKQSIQLLQQQSLLTKDEAKQFLKLWKKGGTAPPHLWPKCEILYLMQLMPANQLPV